MTIINMEFSRPAADGTNVPVRGSLTWTPTLQYESDIDPGEIVLPLGFRVVVPEGDFSVTVQPNGPGWVWMVEENFSGIRPRKIYYSIPDVESIQYTALTQVDKKTLLPLATPEPAWYAYVESIELAMAEAKDAAAASAASAFAAQNTAAESLTAIELSETSASGSAAAAAVSETNAGNSAFAAGESAATALGHRNAAQTARTGAETAQSGAQAARTGAETARTGAESARDAAAASEGAAAGSASAAAAKAVESADAANGFTIGTVTTVQHTTPASATITGTAPTRKLNLGIPFAPPTTITVTGTTTGAGSVQGEIVQDVANPGLSEPTVIGRIIGVNEAKELPAGVKVLDAHLPARANRLPLLANIAKIRTGTFRIFHMGTSIGEATTSAGKMLAEQLKTIYGDSGLEEVRAGLLGGSYENASNGWKKQPYGGPKFTRARGDSTSTALTFTKYFDALTVEWSQEADAAAATVTIDNVSAGTFGAPGAQKYSNRTKFTTTLGWHTVTITAPASGYSYLESLEFADSTRTGIEISNAALGGSSINSMVTLRTPNGAQIAGIPIGSNVGLDSFVNRTNVDMFSMSYVVNDAGLGTSWASGGYKTAVDYMVAKAASLSIPFLIVIEMGGHYSMPNDNGSTSNNTAFNTIREYLLSLRKHNHVTVVDWHAATAMSDYAAYAARYYPGVTNLNVANGTYSGDFIHPVTAAHQVAQVQVLAAAAVQPLPYAIPERVRWDRFRTFVPGMGMDKAAIVAGVTKRYPMPSGVALDPVSTDQGRRVSYYRDSTVTNLGFAATLNGEIAASGTSDKHGNYLDCTNKNLGLGFSPNWAAGDRVRITLKIAPKTDGGSLDFRVGGSAKVYVDGVPITGNVLFQNVSGTDPVVLSVEVGAPAASQFVSITGRVYEAGAAQSTVPLFM